MTRSALSLSALPALALAGLLMTACEDSSSGPAPVGAETQAELKTLAAKVKYLSAPAPSEDAMGGGDFEAAAAKRAARIAADCHETIEEWDETTAYGATSHQVDTVRAFTAAGQPYCTGFEPAYTTTNSYFKDDLSEGWMQTREEVRFDFDLEGGTGSVSLKMTGKGRIHYFSGYDLVITAIDVRIQDMAVQAFKFDLSLNNGRFTAPLSVAPGVDMMAEVDPAPGTVMLAGPILEGSAKVGTFEVLADERVVIRDQAGKVIESH